jgi:hypothetical protein
MAKAKMAATAAHAPLEAADQKLVSQPKDQGTVSALAHEFWIQRGCPLGSPEVDWLRAEEELRASTSEVPDQRPMEHRCASGGTSKLAVRRGGTGI